MSNILSALPRPFFALAPMDDVTDTVFRQVIANCAKPDLFFTEFVNVDGLQSPGKPKLLHKLKFEPLEQPIFAQIWGKIPENYYKTAKELVKMGFAGVDINMGCPDKSVVKNGCCSALINNRDLAKDIITATKEGAAGKLPISVKLRTGFKEVDFSWPQNILEQGVDMLSVHGRTTSDLSKVPARWEDIGRIRQIRDQIALKTLIVGNGDVTSRKQGEELANKYKLDGIMVGRGIFGDPYIFAKDSKWDSQEPVKKIKLYIRHIKLFESTWQPDDKQNFEGLKKFAKMYINGFEGAGTLRNKFVRQQTIEDMISVLTFFTS
jgi:tRNA-dihydrouridine synthase